MRRVILPDWWADECAEDPRLVQDIEIRVARFLGLSMSVVADSRSALDPSRYTIRRIVSSKPSLLPWREVVRLKDELRNGELSLAEFAADLHEVTLALGRRPVYEDPARFFALTFPTPPLRELVQDVAARLAGRSDKAVRQLELTYGGGKTHTLITLHHLFRDPDALPDLPAVREFRAGGDLPRAVPVSLCFDKIDVERGIEGVRGPDGEVRTLLHPWSVLAFQLGGADGLRALHGAGEAEERDTPPAEPLLAALLERPAARGLSTLILVDEVLMYARQKAGANPIWGERIVDFFQYLTQAVAKVDRAAIVASLLATDPRKQRDETGQRLQAALSAVFRRQREEGVQPVRKEDVAEVLRRRFFEPDSLQDQGARRAHVIGVVQRLAALDETTARNKADAERRFLESFPFHPDLTDVFYGRWTQLQGFQRTRGILRTLATALREAERWGDASPLIGPAALLAAPGAAGISEAVRELAGVATAEKTEGRKTDWATLLDAELQRARQIQAELPALDAGREAEQAVVAVFLHSQPIGHKAQTPELRRLAGGAAPDAIELDKGLRRWREISWFLDDDETGAADAGGAPALPRSWRLGNRPNLRQMHDEACRQRVTDALVDERLEAMIGQVKSLRTGADAAGATLHLLPKAPRDVGDDGSFRYVVLGPAAASDSGKPSRLARRFLDETTAPDRPRVHRNAVVAAVLSRDGLEGARRAVRALLGWEEVQQQLGAHAVDPVRNERLRRRKADAERQAPDVVRQAYSVVVTVDETNEVRAFKLGGGAGPLFTAIKADAERARIMETAADAEALLPGGPFDLWRDDEEARFVRDLAGAFSRQPRLPKMLRPRLVLDTVMQGVERGLFVARLARPDGSARTWWREPVEDDARGDPQLEVVLPARAALNRLDERLLGPGALPALWAEAAEAPEIPVSRVVDYFAGGRTVRVPAAGYEESAAIPGCGAEAVRAAVGRAVERGALWLTNGPASVWKEPLPPGALDGPAVLHPPPESLAPRELTAEALPDAWTDGRANGISLSRALSQRRGRTLPWGLVRDGIEAGVKSRWLTLAAGSAAVRCGYEQAGELRVERPAAAPPDPPQPAAPPAARFEIDPAQVQDLADHVSALQTASAGYALRFRFAAALDDDTPADVRAEVDRLLDEILADRPADR